MPNNTLIVTTALVTDTFREALARKIFWGFLVCSTAFILFFIFIMKIDVVAGALATVTIFGHTNDTQEIGQLVRNVQRGLGGFLYTVGMFLAVFASAGLISAVFEPGRIELLLSKPVARVHILLGRYLGNLLVIAINLFYLVVGVWLVFGIKVGIWGFGFLWSAVVTLFVFSVLLTIILLMGVIWESTAVTVLGTFGIMILSGVLSTHTQLIKLLSSETSRNVVRTLYYIFPKTVDIGKIAGNLSAGSPVGDWMPIWTTALFGLAMLGLSIYIFARRNF